MLAYKNRIFAAVAAVCFLFAMLFIGGCGAVNSADGDDPAATEAPATAPAPATAGETEAEDAAPARIEDIGDAEVDAELIEKAKSADDGLPPVARVAGLYVTQPEYRYLLNSYKSGLMLNTGVAAGTDEDVYFWTKTSSNGRTRLDDAREKVLSELHKIKTCAAIAESRGIALGQDEFENISTDLRAQESRFGGRDGFSKVLEDEYGITLEDYWRISELTTLRKLLLDDERASLNVTEAEARSYFDENPDIFGDLVKIRQILFYHDGGDHKNSRSEDDSKKLAEDALAALKGGADAAKYARENSEEPNAATHAGEHIITRGDQFEPEEVLIWAFEAQPGDYTIIEAAFGFYVVRLEEKINRNFEEMRQDIEDILRERRLDENVAGWMKDPAYAMTVDDAVLESIV